MNRLAQLTGFEQITAPFDGMITSRFIDVGSLVTADANSGTPLFSIDRTDVLRVRVFVPQTAYFGIKDGDPSIVGSAITNGDQEKGQTGMENLLQRNPDINLVYTINEPAAFAAYNALRAAGKEKTVTIVPVDGGCKGVQGVKSGQIKYLWADAIANGLYEGRNQYLR